MKNILLNSDTSHLDHQSDCLFSQIMLSEISTAHKAKILKNDVFFPAHIAQMLYLS